MRISSTISNFLRIISDFTQHSTTKHQLDIDLVLGLCFVELKCYSKLNGFNKTKVPRYDNVIKLSPILTMNTVLIQTIA